MKNNDSTALYAGSISIPEENRVPGFDPLRFLKMTPAGPKLDLGTKKVWFRLKYPQGRVMLSAAKIDEQLALIEARVFLNKTDTAPAYTSAVQRMMNEVPGGLYVQAAQNAAIEQVLDEAGFTVHFNGIPGSSTVAAVKENTVREAPVQKKVSAKKDASQKQAPLAVPVVQDKPVQENPAAVEKAAAEKQIAEPIAKPVIEANAVEESKVEAPTEIIIEKSAVKETVSTPVLETIPMPTVEETAETTSAENTVQYTTSTPVEEIYKLMSVKEAFDYVITTGSCKGMTMGQAIVRRPASVKFYTTPGYKGDDNILRASAAIVLNEVEKVLKAG